MAHRDYSAYMRGSQVQVKLFADRLEISSPGGLFGDVTLDTLEEKQSTRNQRLMQMMEDHRLVDNRGTGVNGMIAEMRDAHLEPPRFNDDRSYFRVTFYRHTLLLSGEGIDWLNSVAAALPISDRQRLALLYLRANERMTNSDYRRLHRVDSRVAARELQELVTMGAVEMRGVRGGLTTCWLCRPLCPGVSRNPPARRTSKSSLSLDVAASSPMASAGSCLALPAVNESDASWLDS